MSLSNIFVSMNNTGAQCLGIQSTRLVAPKILRSCSVPTPATQHPRLRPEGLVGTLSYYDTAGDVRQ